MAGYFLGIDQGTTLTTAVLADENWHIVAKASKPHQQHYPAPGWVEHDPMEIYENCLAVAAQVVDMTGATCTGVLLSGHNMFSGSASSANAQLDTDVVQAYLIHSLPRAANIDQISTSDSLPATGSFLYFDNDVFVSKSTKKRPRSAPCPISHTSFPRPDRTHLLPLARSSSIH